MKKQNALPSVLGALLAACAVTANADPIGLDVSVGMANVRPDIKSPVVGADATSEVIPIANFTYYLSEHFALNTAAGITRHEFSNAGGVLGKASMAPFHLMAQYHFMPQADFRPYVGVGIHHTVFFKKSGPAFDGLENFKADCGEPQPSLKSKSGARRNSNVNSAQSARILALLVRQSRVRSNNRPANCIFTIL